MQSYPQYLKGTSMDLASTATSDGKEFTIASSVPVPLPRSDSLGRSARRTSGPKLASSPPPIPPRSIAAVVSSDDGSPSVSPPPVINSIPDSNRKTTKTKKTKTFNFFGNNIRHSKSLHSQQKPRRESDKKQYNNEPFSVGSPVVSPKSPVVRSSSTKTTPTSVAADAVPNPDLGTLDYEHSFRTFEHRSSIPQELISKQNLGSSQQELAEDSIVRTVERSESQTTDSIRKERNQITGKRSTVPANYSMKGIRGPFGEKLESQKRRSGSDFDYEDYGAITAHPTQSQQSLTKELLESQKILGKTKTNDSEKKPPSFLISKHVSKTLKQQASEESMISEELTTTDDERCEHHFEPEPHLASLPDIKTANSPKNGGQKNDGGDGGDGVDLKSITATIGRHLDMREHIVGELYDTEKTYCETLKTLYQTFILYKCSSATPAHLPVPLSSSGGCLESFIQLLPDGMNMHGKLLEQLRHKIANWSPDETDIGNIFEILNDDNLVQFYEYVIQHFNEIMAILKTNQQCIEQKTASSERPKSGSKLMLHDLLISIVQRMFQYKALLERLIKNTKSHHCDYIPLQMAEKNVHDFLNKINTGPGQGIGFGGGGGGGGGPNENHSTSSSSSASAVSNNVRHLFLKELESLIECDQTILEQYGPNPNVHFYDNVMIKKREQTIFVLDSCILLGQRKNKKKSQFELSRYKLQKVFQIENVNLRCQCQRGSYHQSGSIVGSYPLQNMPSQSTSGGGNSGLANGNSGNNVGTFGTNATIGDQFNSITACQICIEHLESDICNLSKMQKRACRLNNETTRRIIESMLYEQLQLVVKQLAEKNERMSRCFIDCSVDIFVSPDLEDPNMDRNDSPQQSSPVLADNKIRITHNKCIRHRKTCGFQPESINNSIRTISGRQTTNQNGGSSDLLTIIFSNFKKREEFESTVNGLKAQIVKSRFRMEFLSQIPYQRARARIQLTCALPAMGTNNIWICQSDGFVGQIGVLSLENINVPMIISCNGVCNARILFLKSVPPCQFSSASDDNRNAVNVEGPKRPQSLMIKNQDRDQFIKVNEDENLDKTLARPRSMSRVKSERRRLSTNCNSNDGDSSNDEENNQTVQQQKVAKKPIKRRSKKLEKHQLKPTNETPVATALYPMQKSSTALGLFPADITSPDCQIIDTDTSFDVLPSKKCNESKDRIAAITPDCPTMWFGTDDSTIHIYSCLNAVRTGKNKAKVTLKAKIESIEYFKGKVFVGLANHTVAIFIRDANGYWQTTPKIIADIHCFRFCVVQQNQLWTTSGNLIQIRDEQLKCIEEPIIIQEVEKICFIIENQSIFIASEQSSYVYRYSTGKPYQLLASISIGQSVDRALKSFEEILRYHKNQCLKICSMHLVRDRILVGTSAGVIVTLDQNNTVEIVPNGHTGNVRFITSTSTSDGRLWVVSGGDGVEKYAPGTSTSTNSPGEFSNFMAYCSHLAQNLLGRTSSNASSLTPAQSQMSILNSSTISGGGGGGGSIVTTPIMAPEDTEILSSPSMEQNYSVVNPIQSPQTPAHSLQHQPRKDEKDSVACGESDSQSYLLVWKII